MLFRSVGSSNTLNVTLELTAGDLEGVVVTALGVSRQKKALGYASTTIAAEELTKTGTPNFATALYGKAPGVRIGATPGGATSSVNITIRGVNSITGRSQPLIVLDGVPIRDGEVNNGDYWGDQRLRGNGLLDINPEDIDNISILKGASAAALYGSEAVNGVVLITTKTGSKGRKGFSVDVNTTFSSDNVAYLPKYQNERGPGAPIHVSNGGQNAEGFIMVDTDGDGTPDTRGLPNFTINFGAPFDGQPTLAWDGKVRPYEAQKDNYKGLFRTAYNSNVNVALSHSSENSNVRFSLTRQMNQGVSLGADNDRNIANFNGNFKLGKKWTTDVMVNYINQRTKNRPYSIDRMINNFTGMMGRFDNADWYLDRYITSLGYKAVTGTAQSLTPDENIIHNGFRADIADYVWRVKEHKEDEWNNRVIASLTNTWQILNNLRLRTRIATDFTSQKSESKQRTEIPLVFGTFTGAFVQGSYQNSIVYGDALLTYTQKINPDLELNVMGGYTASKQTESVLSRSTNGGLNTENFYDVNASVGNANSSSRRGTLVKDALIGTINGNYKDFLYLEATVRRDRTSTMNPNNNSFVYPSVNSSLILSDAFNLPSIVSFAKLRASWGIVGNYPDMYLANVAYTPSTLGVQAGGGGAVLYTTIPTSYGNDGIRPEEKHEIELGIEAKFLKNRVGLELSYYNAQIIDQILPLELPASSGARNILTNIGTLRNSGLEVALTGTPIRNKELNWDLGINFSLNKNTVEKLYDNSDRIPHQNYDGGAAYLISRVGESMGDFYVPSVATDSKGDQIVDPNGLYRLDETNLKKVGNAMPKAIGGFFSSLSYKNFTFDVLLDFRIGGHVMPTGINWMISRGLLEESLNYSTPERGGISYYRNGSGQGVQTDAAQGPNGETVFHDGMLLQGSLVNGQENTNVISQAYYYWNVYNWGGPQYGYSRYELYIKKNNYVKFREVSLSYSLPAKWASKIKASRIQLSVFGRNLFYLYRTLKNLDAEQTVAGSRWWQTVNNSGTNPSTRTVGVMLRASF